MNFRERVFKVDLFFFRMAQPDEVQIAHLANVLLGEPENNLEKFSGFFEMGMDANQVVDTRIRALALLSATAVLIDILPSLVTPEGQQDEEENQVSKDQRHKVKQSSQALSFYDQLVTKLNKAKLVRGPSALLNSSICSKSCLDDRRIAHLVSVMVSLACTPGPIGKQAAEALRTRVLKDLRDNSDNLLVVKLITQSICKEKQPERLNALIPIIGAMRFSTPFEQGGAQVADKQLARDLALGQSSGIDKKKWSQNQGSILSDSMALFVKVLRAVHSTNGIYSFESLKVCIEGVGGQTGHVNADLAIELEVELLELAKYYLITKRMSSETFEEGGLLGTIALSALLNISKGSKERQSVLSNSVISAVELLVPAALNRLITTSSSTIATGTIITDLCKGALGVASQWGSDRCLLSIASALINFLCLRGGDDQTTLVADLIVHIAAKSSMVRAAIDPEGVLVDGSEEGLSKLEKTEIHLFPQLKYLLSHFQGNKKPINTVLGHLSKYSSKLARKENLDHLVKDRQVKDAETVSTKKRRIEKNALIKKTKPTKKH